MIMSILITNAKNRIAYAVTRSLAAKGVEVITADSVRTAMSFYSRHSSRHFIYPAPFQHEQEFIKSLIDNCIKFKPEVLIPVYEETFLIAKHKKVLQDYVNILVPDYEQILMVHNKARLYETCAQLGIPVPKSSRVPDLQTDLSLLELFKFPVLLKPNQGGGAWGIEMVEGRDELLNILVQGNFPHGLPGERFLVQEKIAGTVSCCGMLMYEGKYQAGHCYRQLRETPITGGTATYRESILNPQLISQLRKLLEHLHWNGPCHADFMVEEETGISYLIDVNPRLWGSLFQGIIAGVDFPFLIYKLAKGEEINPPPIEYDTTFRSRWLWGDAKCFLEYLSKPESRGKMRLKDFFVFRSTDRYDDFQLSDPLPFFAWLADYLHKSLKQRTLSPTPHDTLAGIWE